MSKKIACSFVLALGFLTTQTATTFAQSTPTHSAVTGGDPQPTAVPTIVLLSIIPSLAVL